AELRIFDTPFSKHRRRPHVLVKSADLNLFREVLCLYSFFWKTTVLGRTLFQNALQKNKVLPLSQPTWILEQNIHRSFPLRKSSNRTNTPAANLHLCCALSSRR